jgi:D-alanyl-D-alanine carboxypeptidase
MKKIILILAIISISNLRAQINPTLASQLQNFLNSKVPSNHGVSAYLIMSNGDTWSGTAGVDGLGNPITDTTVFHGASTTKLNISLLIQLLAEDGLLHLDSAFKKYLSLSVSFNPAITVRQLLNHTSGIKDYLEAAGTPSNVTTNFSYSYSPQYILQNIVSTVPDFAPGTNFKYSSTNYLILALLAEAVTGNPVQNELRARIWNPLGMKHTYFGATETYTEQTAGVWWNFGSGVTNYNGQSTTSMLSYGYGGANIVTCPKDLALLLRALMDGQILNAFSMSQMQSYVPASYSASHWVNGYGLGIHHQYQQSNDTVIGHDGYYTNLTDAFYSKKYGFTLVTMTNTETAWFGLFNPMYTMIKNFITIGMPEYESEMELSVYPNPTSGQISIKSTEAIDRVIVKNITGHVIHDAKPADNTVSLMIEGDGVYFVTIQNDKHVVTRKLIVAQR